MLKKNLKSVSYRLFILFIIIGLIVGGPVNFNILMVELASGGSGGPPINGTTSQIWYVDGPDLRDNETITTVDIQVNATGALEWVNIDATINGPILVESGGYFNLTDCTLTITGNFTINGTVNLKSTTVNINSAAPGEYHIEVFGSMYISDKDSDDSTTGDASLITAVNTANNYQFWVRENTNFSMRYSILRECGYSAPPYRTQQYGLFLQGNGAVVENNTIEDNLVGVLCYYSMDHYIANNTIQNNEDGIRLYFALENRVYGNTISSNNDDGIELTGAFNNTIDFNTVSSNDDDGIDIDAGSDNNVIVNNTVTSNDFGIFVTSADGNLISNNTLSSNFFTGLGFRGSINNSVMNNKIVSNTLQGVYLDQSSSGNRLHWNNISANGLDGVYVDDAASAVNATYNWWGDSSGPSHTSNPGGSGESVTNYVTFKPWLKKSLEDINPDINVSDITTATEDQPYSNTYGTYDADVGDIITWRFDSNSSFLTWDAANLTLSGTPTNADVGDSWVLVKVTYGYGGTDEHNFTLTVDNVDPIILTSDITSVDENSLYSNDYASDDDGQGNVVWRLNSNASWLDIVPATGVLSGTPGSSDVGSFWVNVTVDDGNGGFDSSNFTVTVLNTNDPPVIQTTDDTTALEDIYYQVVYTATDPDPSDTITWSFETNATWLAWGSANHTLYGTPRNTDLGTYWVNINISDGNGGYDEHNFTLSVTYTNDPPVIQTADVTAAVEDSYFEVAYTAVDEEDDTLTWMPSTNANWVFWGPVNHTLYGTPRNSDVGTSWVIINVTDGNGGYDEHSFEITVTNTNDDPVITTEDLLSVNEDSYYWRVYTATDIDPTGDTLSWSLDTNASWLGWSSGDDTLFGLPTNDDLGTYWVWVNVSDGKGGKDSHFFEFTVINTNDGPVITTSDLLTAIEDQVYTVSYTATDVDTGDVLTWYYDSNASWLNWDSMNQTLYGTPENADVGTYRVKIRVADSSLAIDEHLFNLTVINTNDKPVITTTDVTTAPEDQEYRVSYTANDVDAGDVLIWKFETDATWLSWGEGNHTVYGTPENNDVGTYSVKIKVTDSASEFDDHSFLVTVINVNDPPVISGAPTDLLVNPDTDLVLDLVPYVSDVDNTVSELSLVSDSEHATTSGLSITFNLPGSISNETVEVMAFDSVHFSKPHIIMITVTTGDLERPEIDRALPQGSNINISKDIIVEFSREMAEESVKAAFSVSPSVSGAFRFESNIMWFTPTEPLSFNTTYEVKIGSSAMDDFGNTLEDDYSWNFTTMPKPVSDADSDGDGYPDVVDSFPADPEEWSDNDDDGTGDNADPDDDNDDLTDTEEEELGTSPTSSDTDADGHADGDDAYPLDPKRWEKGAKEPGDEGTNWGIIAGIILVIIAIVIVLFMFILKPLVLDKKKEEVAEEASTDETLDEEQDERLENKQDGL